MGQRGLASCAVIVAAGVLVAAQAPQEPGPRPAGAVAVTAQNAALLRSWDARVDAMRRSGELVLSRSRADTVLPGRTHERYQQYVNGIRVVGGEITRQVSGGVTTSIFGELHEVTGLPARPGLSEDAARAVFRGLSTRELPARRRIELVILRTDDGRYVLSYTAHITTAGGWMRTYVDASDGRVLRQFRDVQTQAAVGTGSGVLGDSKKISVTAQSGRFVADDGLRPPTLITYDMQGNLPRAEDYIFGFYDATAADVASDTDNAWTDGANVDAHVYLGYTYDYYFKRFGRKGLDDRDAPIYAITHPVEPHLYRIPVRRRVLQLLLNAFWCAGCGPDVYGAMVFGEGLRRHPAGRPDVRLLRRRARYRRPRADPRP